MTLQESELALAEPPAALDTITDGFDALRARARAAMAEDGLSGAKMAQLVGRPDGTLSQWMAGTYKGRNAHVAADVERWLETRAARRQARAALPVGPGFVRTPTAVKIWELLSHAQHACDLVVLSGGAGIGKTTTIEAYAASNVTVVTGQPTMSSPYAVMDQLAEALRIGQQPRYRRSVAVIERLRGSNGLIVVDEAQHYSNRALDQLRTIHDQAGIGLALVGNETTMERIEGEGRTANFAQLFSRIGMRMKRPKPTSADVEAILTAWSVPDGTRVPLRGIARKDGALRIMVKVLRLAHAQAQGAALAASHVQAAWTQLGDRSVLDVMQAAA